VKSRLGERCRRGRRRGHTEVAVDLARLAGLYQVGPICEIMNDDGTMARVPWLILCCKGHRVLMITVAELTRYRRDSEYEELLIAIPDVFPMTVGESASQAYRLTNQSLI
jgi:3,4-dihydroxy-2-butanone 4-phosphate synthase